MSTKEFGCFFCDAKSTTPTAECPACARPIDIGSQLTEQKLEEYEARSVLGRGFYAWTVCANDGLQDFAIKIIPILRVKKKNLTLTEPVALARCGQHPNIARFIRAFDAVVNISDVAVEVRCLVFEFIENAVPLHRFLGAPGSPLSRTDVAGILTGISAGLTRMHTKELWHNDLHDDNILVRNVATDENRAERFESKLIDFGSARTADVNISEKEGRSDYSYLAKHIYSAVAAFENTNAGHLMPADRTFSSRLRALGRRLGDKDISRRSCSPSAITIEIKKLLATCVTGYDFPSFIQMKEESHVSLSEPLENTNALSLAPQDISLLFRDALDWQVRIGRSEPVIIVGPRGCGKTMLLRFLSITSQARPLANEQQPSDVAARLEKLPYIGFLVSGGQLRTPFIRSPFKKLEHDLPNLAEEFCREFLSAHFVLEVLRTMVWLSGEGLARIRVDDLSDLTAVISELAAPPEEQSKLKLRPEMLVEYLERRITALSNLSGNNDYRPSNLSCDDVLVRLARGLRNIQWIRAREVWFMLDDYSETVLPEIAQRAYNPVLFRLSSEHRIRMSSEGNGPVLEDSLGRKYKEGRELSFVNLGEVYFQSDESAGRKFFEQILEARFNEVGKGSLRALKKMLGRHPREESFGQYIRDLPRPGNAQFHGFSLLCRLCSGDVSFIIELLHTLTRGAWDVDAARIPEATQDALVKQFAQRQLADLRRISGYGTKLYTFAQRLGNLIKHYLLSETRTTRADERLRLEIEGVEKLSREAHLMEEALLRHSVLVQGGAGKSRGGLPTQKLYFRRLFAPCFPFSPSRHGCMALKVAEYERWLVDPAVIWSGEQGTGTLFGGD